jgi:hypothetical protein
MKLIHRQLFGQIPFPPRGGVVVGQAKIDDSLDWDRKVCPFILNRRILATSRRRTPTAAPTLGESRED